MVHRVHSGALGAFGRAVDVGRFIRALPSGRRVR